MRRSIAVLVPAAALLLGVGSCLAQSAYGTQPPPTSPYPDGTGDVAVDGLNAGQLDQNYRGPWHQIPADRVRPGIPAPVNSPGGGYPQSSYSQGSHSQASYPPGGYPKGSYIQGIYPRAASPQTGYARPVYPPTPYGS